MKDKVYSVFISYSWTSEEHEKWVRDLAQRLMEDGIEVKLDQWDLKPGQDKFSFMESMVNDEKINKVLLICEKGYKEKADNRTGGVGAEAQIITPEIYNKAHQEKFIPVIAECGEAFDSYMPAYLKTRIGIDLSIPGEYTDGYEKLLRTIAERPMYRKPTRGTLPPYLFEEEKSHFKTQNLNKQLKSSLINKREHVDYVISDFVEEFKKNLEGFKIQEADVQQPLDEQIYNAIRDMQPLRDDYIEFLSLICKAKYAFDIDIIIRLFEKMYSYTKFQGLGGCYQIPFDHFKFCLHELFLYTTILLLEFGLYDNLQILLTSRFFVKDQNTQLPITFSQFRFYISSLDEHRKKRLNSQYYSPATELLIQRSTFNNKNYKEQLLDADLLLHYISVIDNKDTRYWFPATCIYSEDRRIELLVRLTSRRFFEKVKILFNVMTKEEMQAIITNFPRDYSQEYSSAFRNVPSIQNHIKPEDICSYP